MTASKTFSSLVLLFTIINLGYGQFYYSSGTWSNINFYNENTNETTASYSNFQQLENYVIDNENNQLIIYSNISGLQTLNFEGSSTGALPGSDFVNFYSNGNKDLIYISDENQFYFVSSSRIEMIDLDEEDGSLTVINTNAGGIALDQNINKLFWTDKTNNKVMKSNMDGSDIEEVYYLPSGLADLDDVEVDEVNQMIYWTNKGQGRIQRCKYDGTEFENLITTLSSPISLVLDETELYWIDQTNNKIMYHDIANATTETFDSEFSGGINLQKNKTTNQLFWFSNPNFQKDILKMNLSTKEVDGVLSTIDYELFGLILDPMKEKLLINSTDKIISCNLDGSNSRKIIDVQSTDNESFAYDPIEELIFIPEGFRVSYINLSSDTWENFDADPNNNYTFNNLQIDITNKKLYWSSENKIYRGNYDGGNQEEVFTSTNTAEILAYYIDGISDRIYYSSGGFIRRANIDGMTQEPIINGGTSSLIVDAIRNRLYYLKSGNIYYSDLDGYFETLFIDGPSGITTFKSIEINSFNLLPLIIVEANATGSDVTIEWTMDENFSGFVNNSVAIGNFFIERKTMTEDWTDIGTLSYFEGVSTYSYTDDAPEFGLNSYRLRYISDNGGLTSYSKNFEVDYLVGVETELPDDLKLWYAHLDKEIKTEGFTGQLNIYNQLGQLQLSQEVNSDISQHNVLHLESGIHFAEIITTSGIKYAKSFLLMK